MTTLYFIHWVNTEPHGSRGSRGDNLKVVQAPVFHNLGSLGERFSVSDPDCSGFSLPPLHTFRGQLTPLTGVGLPLQKLSLFNQNSSELCSMRIGQALTWPPQVNDGLWIWILDIKSPLVLHPWDSNTFCVTPASPYPPAAEGEGRGVRET